MVSVTSSAVAIVSLSMSSSVPGSNCLQNSLFWLGRDAAVALMCGRMQTHLAVTVMLMVVGISLNRVSITRVSRVYEISPSR